MRCTVNNYCTASCRQRVGAPCGAGDVAGAIGGGSSGKRTGGVCAILLHDALRRTLQAADIAGIRAVIVHAKDDDAKRFYEHFDFDPSPTDAYHLFLLIKGLRKLSS